MLFNKKSLMLVLPLMIILIFSFVSVAALDCDSSGFKGYAKLNENKSVCVTCPTCSYINISTVTPNGTELFSNEVMNESNNRFCYDFTGTQNDQLGIYEINGFSQLDEPLGLCYEVTFSGKPNNIGAYIISIIIVLGLLIGIIWLNKKFNKDERERLYKKLVIGFLKAKTGDSKADFAVMIFYVIVYGILDMIFILYYLDVMLFLFLFKDLAVAFGLNTFSLLMPQLIIISLWGLTLLGVFFTLKLFKVVTGLISDITDAMRGIYD